MSIGTLRENSLHASIKSWYAGPEDQIEVLVDGFHVDILTSGGSIVEIQTQSFAHIKRKLNMILVTYPVRLVYPIARERWVVRLDSTTGEAISRRRSPKKGQWHQVFWEMVSFPELLDHPNFSLELLLTQEEEILIRIPEPQPGKKQPRASWRRKGWMIDDRRLLDILDRRIISSPIDLLSMLPEGLPATFSTSDLARLLSQPPQLAQKMLYCLRKTNLVQVVGMQRKAYRYQLAPSNLNKPE